MSQPHGKHPEQEARETAIPTVSRVLGDTIVELVYDPDKRETALAVSRFGGLWNIERELRVGSDTYVPYSPNNNLIRTGCVLLPSRPEHHGDKAELLSAIEAFLRRYVQLSPTYLRIASHYILLSWVYDAFNELPYLRLQGDFGTGKTRGLIAIGSVMYKPFFASGASTISPIFHILENFGGTLVLDEADFRFSDVTNELVKILNNGTMRGLPVLRTMQNQYKELNPRAFRVFGPKIVAMRASYQDRGLESRFITEDMNTQSMPAGIPVHLPNELREEALALRNRLLHYRFCALFSVHIDPALLVPEAAPRVNQVALPLLSIMDDAELRRQMCELLARDVARIPTDRDDKAAAVVVRVLVDAFKDDKIVSITVGDVAERTRAYSGAQYATRYIGHLIRTRLGVRAHKSNGSFVITRDSLPDIERHVRHHDDSAERSNAVETS